MDYRLHCNIKCYPDRVYRMKTGFKFSSTRLRRGRVLIFHRHINCAIPYPAKYYMKRRNN